MHVHVYQTFYSSVTLSIFIFIVWTHPAIQNVLVAQLTRARYIILNRYCYHWVFFLNLWFLFDDNSSNSGREERATK